MTILPNRYTFFYEMNGVLSVFVPGSKSID